MPGFGESPPLAATPRHGAGVAQRRRCRVHAARARAAIHAARALLGSASSARTWPATRSAAGSRWSSRCAGHARSVTAIAPAGPVGAAAAAHALPRASAARALGPLLPALLRTERGRRAALGGTIAHPERVPYAAALAARPRVRDAPGFDAVNDGMRAGRFTGLGEIHVPLTLAWPEHDRLVGRPRDVPASAQEFVLRGCGHMPTWDDPEQVAQVLLAGSQSPAP